MSAPSPEQSRLSPAEWIALGAAPLFLVYETLARGVPAVRHDWFWPIERQAFLNTLLTWTSGWDATGLGHPAVHLTQYLLVIPLALVGTLAGSEAALGVYVGLIGWVIARSQVRLARLRRLPRGSAPILTALLILNPWVYDQLVAGHLPMLLAYAAVALLWTELSLAEPDRRIAVLAMLGASLQAQFLVFAFLACALSWRKETSRACMLFGALAYSPSGLGILTHLSFVQNTPLNLVWEQAQSVPLPQVFLLQGYFARYDEVFRWWPATAAILALALPSFALPLARPSRSHWKHLSLILLIIAVASGVSGPLSPMVRLAFERFPAFGLFRELYDLVGLLAIGYAVALGHALAACPPLRWLGSIAAVLLFVVWVGTPPSSLWVAANSLPQPATILRDGRFALFPPFQPVTYRGKGSGVDPAIASGSFNRIPLNTYFVSFPETTVLSEYEQRGTITGLAQLGTTEIDCRRGFRESPDAVFVYGASLLRFAQHGCADGAIHIAAASSLVAVQPRSSICSLCNEVGAGNIWYADAGKGAYHVIPVPRGSEDPTTAWIDARLTFAAKPELGQAFGGVFTTSRAMLSLSPAPFALMHVRGKLNNQSATAVVGDTHGWRWVQLPPSTTAVQCLGECAVAIEGDPIGYSLNPPPVSAVPAPWTSYEPWLLVATIPPGTSGTLRYLESYDFWWTAFEGWKPLEHVRLDATTNGWIVPPHTQPNRIVIVHLVSFGQLGCELAVVVAFVYVLFWNRAARRSGPG